jgi:hypothetical protein
MRKLLFIIAVLSASVFAQQGSYTVIRAGGSLPLTCTVGSSGGGIFQKTGTSPGVYFCSASNTWSGPFGASTATVTHTGALTSNQIVLGNGSDDIKPLGSLGTTTTVLHGNASGAPSFGSVVGSDMTNNTVTSTQLAVVNTRRTCMIPVGDGTTTVVSGDYSPFKAARCFFPYAATIVEVALQCDAGTPSIQFETRHANTTLTDILSGALAANGTTLTCALTSTSGTCIDGTTSSGSITISTTSIAAGDWIEVKSGTASTEKNCSAAFTVTVN